MRIRTLLGLLFLGFTLMVTDVMASSNQSAPPLQYQLSQVTISVLQQPSRGLPGKYNLTISGDGAVSYTQEVDGKTIETHETISKEQLLSLINSFYRIHFFELDDTYTTQKSVRMKDDTWVVTVAQKMVDQESMKLCIQLADYKKCVTIVDAKPAEAAMLAKKIEALVD